MANVFEKFGYHKSKLEYIPTAIEPPRINPIEQDDSTHYIVVLKSDIKCNVWADDVEIYYQEDEVIFHIDNKRTGYFKLSEIKGFYAWHAAGIAFVN